MARDHYSQSPERRPNSYDADLLHRADLAIELIGQSQPELSALLRDLKYENIRAGKLAEQVAKLKASAQGRAGHVFKTAKKVEHYREELNRVILERDKLKEHIPDWRWLLEVPERPGEVEQ